MDVGCFQIAHIQIFFRKTKWNFFQNTLKKAISFQG